MLNLLIGFVLGYIVAVCLTYLLGLGRSVIMLKQIQYIAATVFSYIDECLLEATIYKEIAMDESSLSEREKDSRRILNRNTINTIQQSSVKSFINLWPDNYSNLLEFRNWEQMKTYLENQAIINKELK
tara:strand:- start:2035 stop:2418 length:384 start_codon:yes stop_codon:yes gene_type:complete